MTQRNVAPVPALPDEDTELVQMIARALYLRFCDVRGFEPQPEPFVPAWCIDYGRVALAIVLDDQAHGE